MKKLEYLDGLRGLAAVVVTIAHFFQIYYPAIFNGDINAIHTQNGIENIIYNTPLNLILNANFSVCIFFVLSGYVLSIKFFKYRKKEVIISSAVRRYFRLVVPIAASLVIAHILMNTNSFFLKDIINISQTDVIDRYSINYGFLTILKQGFFEVFFFDVETYNAALWTIKYEFIGSFIIFVFLLYCGNSPKRKYVYIILMITFLNSYYLAFILGVMLADINNNHNLSAKSSYIKTSAIFIIALFLGSYPYSDVNDTIYSYLSLNFLTVNSFRFYHIIGAFLLMFAILSSPRIQYKLSNKFMKFIGNISFSMYLIHFTVINSLSCYMFKLLIENYGYHLSFLVTFTISFLVIILVSYLMYNYIDLVGIKLSDTVYRNILSMITTINKSDKRYKSELRDIPR